MEFDGTDHQGKVSGNLIQFVTGGQPSFLYIEFRKPFAQHNRLPIFVLMSFDQLEDVVYGSGVVYVGLQNEADVLPFVSPNMPLWRDGLYTLPFNEMKRFAIPALIVGPWGKDLHKITERVYLPDLVEHTPLLIERLIEEFI